MPIIEAHNERVANALRASGRTEALEVGPGDDCAVLAPSTERTVVTTDTLVQDQDFMDPWPGGFDGTRSSGYEVGRKSATQNLADVAAMGARPVSLFVSLSLPGETPTAGLKTSPEGSWTVCTPAEPKTAQSPEETWAPPPRFR